MPKKIVIASGNAGKLREIKVLLKDLDIAVVAQSALGVLPGPETGDTFVENALQKAVHAARLTGLPAFADDSGLVVQALGGQPGIRSARYAGDDASDEDNIDKLLGELADVTDRDAHFHCAAVYVRSATDASPLVAEASWHGSISLERRGSGGFGYDPVFFVADAGCNSAELSAADKNARSHRGLAFRRLADMLADELTS